ncbi:hypothetical protein [Sphingobacterium multivorum]|uniref:hypothetical protein n=1 Tax=Sphingobacterium multivorum TaxID=28454 RepID=UPI0031BBA2CB
MGFIIRKGKRRQDLFKIFFITLSCLIAKCYGQQVQYEKKWSEKLLANIVETGESTTIQILSSKDDSLQVSKEFKFADFQRGAMEISGEYSGDEPPSTQDIKIISIGYKDKMVVSYMSEKLFKTNDPIFDYYVPFGSKIDSLAVFILGKVTGQLKLKNVKFKFSEGEFSKNWQAHFSKIARNPEKINQLALIGKVWGALKYFSPVISQKKIDWDQVLRDELKRYFYSNNPREHQEIIERMLSQTRGAIEATNRLDTFNRESFNVDYNWLERSPYLLPQQRGELKKIIAGFYAFNNQYISTADQGTGYLTTIKENKYHSNDIVTVYDRVLSLFRYWNIINYYYPYKIMLKEEWPGILDKWLPEFITASEPIVYGNRLLKFNAELKDGHSSVPLAIPYELMNYIYQSQIGTIPAHIKIVGNKVKITAIDSAFSSSSGLKIGDQVISIGNSDLPSIIKNLAEYIGASRMDIKKKHINNKHLLSYFPLPKDKKPVLITIRRNGKIRNINFIPQMQYYNVLAQIHEPKPVLKAENKIRDGIYKLNKETLYFNIGDIGNYIDEDSSIYDGIKNVIVDLRIYPKTYQDFPTFTNPSTVFSYLQQSVSVPGWVRTIEMSTPKTGYSFPGNVTALISEETISNGEFLALMLKTRVNKVKFVGRATAGADGNVLNIPLIGFKRFYLYMSSIRVLDNERNETMGVGIIPDLFIDRVKEMENPDKDLFIETALKQFK